MTRKICVVITARSSYARIKSALHAIKSHPDLELQLVVAGSAVLSRYGDAINFIEKDGFEVAARVYSVIEGETPLTSAKSTGMNLIELATCFDNLNCDVVVSIADRYETMATAVGAAYMNLPLVHIQGGEITGSIDEKVRHAVTKLADLHFVSTEQAAKRVIRMGEDPEKVYVTGCPSIDLAGEVLKHTGFVLNPSEQYGGIGPSLDISSGYAIAIQHPVTTEYDEALNHVTQTLHAVYDVGLPTFWFWPNVDAGSDGTSKGIRRFREQHPEAKMHFFRNMSPEDFLRLAYHSRVVVGNSSFGIREASYLGIPAVNIGSRQNGRERGENVIDVHYVREDIVSAIRKQVSHGKYPQSYIYGDGFAGPKIADALSQAELTIEKKLPY